MHGSGWWSYVKYDEEQDRPKVDRALLRRVLGYARPYRGRLALVLGTILVISLLSLAPPLLMRALIDTAIPAADLALVTALGLGMVAVPLINGVIGVVQRWASASMGQGIIFDLRRQLFDHVQRQSMEFLTNTKTGELMSRLNTDVVGAQQAVTSTFVTLASNIVAVVATLAIMLGLEWRLTALAIAILPFFLLTSRSVGKKLRLIRRRQMEERADMNSLMQETLSVSGALLAKLFGRIDDENARFSGQASEVRELAIRQATIGSWFFMSLGVVSAVGTAIVFWVGAVLVIEGALTIGTIVALSAYLQRLYGPLSSLTNTRVEFATSLVSFERVFEVLDMPRSIEERGTPIVLEAARGRVEFERVSFAYGAAGVEGLESVRRYAWSGMTREDEPDARRRSDGWALRDLSFVVEPGETVALVGPSGAGKTTLTYLVPRLYDATEGTVRIDGHDVRDLGLTSIAAAVGVVTQETYLFHDTIEANIQYSRPGASPEEIRVAARAANIEDFIEGLPSKYDTVVGERGYRLSGGEKQRIAIARVLLKDPRILILDEATSHLDAHSEALIQEALEGALENRTSLVIAHRLATVLEADRILVLDRGRIAEQGRHESLLADGGLYASLFHTQFRPAERRTALGS
ncbi:MAG: ABC transporter ATP-binding protein/permease [Gemmatimonadetes bacterium]|nr:ABC transporter ATP-binding protein/permease [Gemmatimonadota bacterium]